MPDFLSRPEVDLSGIHDPDVRRVLRAMQTQVAESLKNQQLEIDALFEMMMEHHIGSIGEFKRHLIRLQQNTQRGQRIHDAMTAAAQIGTGAPVRPGAH